MLRHCIATFGNYNAKLKRERRHCKSQGVINSMPRLTVDAVSANLTASAATLTLFILVLNGRGGELSEEELLGLRDGFYLYNGLPCADAVREEAQRLAAALHMSCLPST